MQIFPFTAETIYEYALIKGIKSVKYVKRISIWTNNFQVPIKSEYIYITNKK